MTLPPATSRQRPHRGAAAAGRLRPSACAARRPRRRAPRSGEHVGRGLDRALVDCALYVGGAACGEHPTAGRGPRAARVAGPAVRLDRAARAGRRRRCRRSPTSSGLHPLAVEDAVHAHQRPKLEQYGDDALFVVLKTVRYVDARRGHRDRRAHALPRRPLRRHRAARRGRRSWSTCGPSSRPARSCWPSARPPCCTRWSTGWSTATGRRPTPSRRTSTRSRTRSSAPSRLQPTERIYKLKREVMEFRRAVEPLVPATGALSNGSLACLDERTVPYFRDVHDHVVRSSEHVGAMGELLDSVLRPTSRRCRCARTRTCARSAPGSRSPP